MSNPLFDVLSGGNGQMLGNLGSMASLMQQFNQFRNNFKGNPRDRNICLRLSPM